MQYFRTGRIITLFIASIILGVSFAMGKIEFFLLLNDDLGNFADTFFGFFTYAGDGLMWIPVLLITIFLLKIKESWVSLVSAFVITTILTQICKLLIIPNEMRPAKAITDSSLIHMLASVTPHSLSSFPSGHTATAFTFYLLFCLFLNRRWWLSVGLIYALLVSYSRIYLAQHFPLDIAAGMIVGAVSVTISLQIQRWWQLRKTSRLKKDGK